MTLGIVGLSAAYIILALLLLSISLYSQLHWLIKAISIILTSLFYAVSWLSFPPLLGWPTKQELPAQFMLVSSQVVQPDKESGKEGKIYLWVRRMEHLQAAGPPRAYQLTYTNALHDLIIKTQNKLDKGIQQVGEFKEPEENIMELLDDTRTRQISEQIEFYNLPDPLFPDK